jgi:ribonucleotide monophosphatase NagD (HAD superfamily)
MAIEAMRGSFRTEGDRREPWDGRVAMVGDRISSDIDGGRLAGLGTILVLSGTTSREAAAEADPAPDFVVEDLAGLLA